MAADIGAGAGELGEAEGARVEVRHAEPSRSGECVGSYRVQLDRVGALIVWCADATGATVSSHITTAHARQAGTAGTFIVAKPAGATLVVTLERRGGRAVIVGAR